MSERFRDINIEWKGKPYVIPANRVFGAIARAEEHILLDELAQGARTGRLPLTKAAKAWEAVLRYAGCRDVSAEDIYADMFSREDTEGKMQAVLGLTILQAMMIPPEHLMPTPAADEAPTGGKASPDHAARRKPASERRSGKNGARQRNSGR